MLAHRIVGRAFLPEGPRFATLDAYDDDGAGPLALSFTTALHIRKLVQW